MQKKRVVVFLDNHSVSEVVKDDPGIEVLVIDRDTYACDAQTRLRNVVGDDASLTAMAHGLPLHDPAKVERAFAQVCEALAKKGENALAKRVAAALFAQDTRPAARGAKKTSREISPEAASLR